ncbi:MAG TPA: asparagine synthase (glutamine-hydrolyzing) [Bryobacteraceae bacterium]|jgi:asparagine synthase (glutamine-hydrolysing)
MCGIAGFYLRNRAAEPADIRAMCDAIVHRGPDDEGVRVEGGCAIGMRRLSIIDLNTGHQPISNEDGTVWIVFNGEIYNYQELRRDLIAKGHQFKTNSDTETIIHLYEEEGPEGVRKLRGMFGFAIWDSRKRSLFVARDRFGKKPIYYTKNKDGFYFGSELKCLRVFDLDWEIDTDALRLYFECLFVPDPYTPFRNVRKLMPGCWIRYHADGSIEEGRYWRLPEPESRRGIASDPARTAAEVREKFDESVRIRMIADVPLGAFLSGGIDSGSVVASMALQSKEPVKTFSIGFEEADYNELPAARLVADQYKTDHHEIIVRPDSVSLVERIARHCDEPLGDSSCIPTLIVSEFARKHVKVALSGDGGDELFGGYRVYFDVEEQKKFDAVPRFLRKGLSAVADRLPYSAYGKNYLRMMSRPTGLDRYLAHRGLPYFVSRQLLQPEWMLPAEAEFFRRQMPDFLLDPDADPLAQAFYFEGTAVLSGQMLVKVDRMSMAASLEVRSPLLDQELAEMAMAIPPDLKMRNGRGKAIFLDAVGDRLPAKLLTLPKKGFAVPLAKWYRTSLKSFLWDHLSSSEFLGRGMVSGPFVRTLLEEHQSGRRDNSDLLYSLLMLELWFRDWKQPKRRAADVFETVS